MRLIFALLLCAAAARAEIPEVVLERGGELTGPPRATVEFRGDEVIATGEAEVPGDSRPQAALALADANARAELLSAVRVGIATAESQLLEAQREEVETATLQVARGVLPGLPPARHGWRKVKRGGEIVLQLWSELRAQKSALLAAFNQALGRGQRVDAAAPAQPADTRLAQRADVAVLAQRALNAMVKR